MFPMPSGFSVAVSPDPDADGTQTADAHDSSSTVTKPLARSSSDPNMSVPDPVPWVPPYPAPPMYRRDEQVGLSLRLAIVVDGLCIASFNFSLCSLVRDHSSICSHYGVVLSDVVSLAEAETAQRSLNS